MSNIKAKIRVIFLIICCFHHSSFAGQTYIVKKGDTLSSILSKKFPKEKVYGVGGSLARVLRVNSYIKNPDYIYPAQIINLQLDTELEQKNQDDLANDFSEQSPLMEQPTVQQQASRSISQFTPVYDDSWNISLLYGAKYISVSQNGALGSAETGTIFLDNIQLNSDFYYNKWSFEALADSYTFKYQSLTRSASERMNSLMLLGGYEFFAVGFDVSQNPMFKNDNGDVQVTKLNTLDAIIGLKLKYKLEAQKNTQLNFKILAGYPISASTESSNIKVSNIKGYSILGQAQLNRHLLDFKDSTLNVVWSNQLKYKSINHNVEWGLTKGNVNSDLTDFSTLLGLQLMF